MSDDDTDELGAEEGERGLLRQLVPEAVKRALYMGLGAVFMTEEGIRNAVSDLKLPKDALSAMLQSADKARQELMRTVADEVGKVLTSSQLRDQIMKVLTSLSIEVKAEVRLKDAAKSGGSTAQVSIKRGSE